MVCSALFSFATEKSYFSRDKVSFVDGEKQTIVRFNEVLT